MIEKAPVEVVEVEAVFEGTAVADAEAPVDDFEMALGRFGEFMRVELSTKQRRINELEAEVDRLRNGTG